MASTYSTNLGLELITTGEQAGTWGTTTNLNLGTLIEQAISGYVTQAITDGADTVITIPDGASGVARNMFIEMTGALTATRNLIVPADRKLYFIYNNTTGGFAVTVKVTGLTGVSVPNGRKVILVCNGTDIVEAHNAISGNATVGGTLVVTGATTSASLSLGTALPVASGGTGVTSSTGTGNTVLSISPALTTPNLGTPSAGTLTNCTFPTLNQNTTGNAATATTSAALTNGGTLNTPGSGTLTNCTGLPIVAGTTGTLSVARGGTGVTGSTGSGSVVLSTSPSLTTPALGTPSSGNLSNCTNFPTLNQNTTGSSGSCTGNAATATNPQSGGTFVTSSNIGSQSVSFATTSTNATNATNATTATNLSGGSVSATTITSSGDITAGGNLRANNGFVASGNAAGTYTDLRYDGDISGYGGWSGVTIGGDLNVAGNLSKSSGSFKIPHPLPEKTDTHHLVHSFIEAPKADLIYSGMVRLVSGYAHINIDAVSKMTAGTFEVLCRDVRRSTTNESGFAKIRSDFYGSSLHIYAESQDCVDEVFWQVIAERQDKHMYDTGWTDDEGHVITEPMRDIEKERKREADYEARKQSLLASNNS